MTLNEIREQIAQETAAIKETNLKAKIFIDNFEKKYKPTFDGAGNITDFFVKPSYFEIALYDEAKRRYKNEQQTAVTVVKHVLFTMEAGEKLKLIEEFNKEQGWEQL